jgi:hypothetical protein
MNLYPNPLAPDPPCILSRRYRPGGGKPLTCARSPSSASSSPLEPVRVHAATVRCSTAACRADVAASLPCAGLPLPVSPTGVNATGV